MKRSTLALAVVLLTNTLGVVRYANACGGAVGVYRAPIVRSYAPAIRYARLPRAVAVHRPIQNVRPVGVATSTALHQSQSVPQIRLAPTQIRQRTVPTGMPAVSQPSPSLTPSPSPATRTAPSLPAPVANESAPSALAILSGQQVSTPTSAARHIGVWTANANGQATVTLSLNNDDSFQWVAVSEGTTQRFHGDFEVAGNKMTLSRSSDNQKLAGVLTFNDSGFNFKLDGTKDSGLNFVRQN